MAGGVNRAWIVGTGSGERGVTHMLNLMAATARRAARDPDIRALAESITANEDTYRGKANAIHDWIVSHIKYVPDPIYVDVIKPPARLCVEPFGDCDDLATLDAALLGSIGIQSRVQAVGFGEQGAPYSHVFTLVKLANDWIASDTTPEVDNEGRATKHYAFGEEPPGIVGMRKARDV